MRDDWRRPELISRGSSRRVLRDLIAEIPTLLVTEVTELMFKTMATAESSTAATKRALKANPNGATYDLPW